MGQGVLQLYIEDNYRSSISTIRVALTRPVGKKIFGVELGLYKGATDVEIKIVNGRIILIHNETEFNCEVPGEYKDDYSLDVE
jgi:hypothetical protein